jgi:hypothetical protein
VLKSLQNIKVSNLKLHVVRQYHELNIVKTISFSSTVKTNSCSSTEKTLLVGNKGIDNLVKKMPFAILTQCLPAFAFFNFASWTDTFCYLQTSSEKEP